MKNDSYYSNLSQLAFAGTAIDETLALEILTSPEVELLPLLQASFVVRREYFQKKVQIHILNNAQNGLCSEDCSYCAQGKNADKENIEPYTIKSDDEIMAEAERAHQAGAFRYCMVFAGRGPSDSRVDHLCKLISDIKEKFPLQVCVSPGILGEGQALRLKEAGLDRLNHNLNTTIDRYEEICSTHTYAERIQTLNDADKVGLEICSGFIAGMGEGPEGVFQILNELSLRQARSIPVNFLIPIEGAPLKSSEKLSPEYALRILCLARLMNPKSDVRAAGGREHHLGSMQALALYPANSVFMDGYLNVLGDHQKKTLSMIKQAGFEIECHDDKNIQDLYSDSSTVVHKNEKDLHPTLTS